MSERIIEGVAFKNAETIERFVENVYKTFGISASIYKSGELVAKYEFNELKTKEMSYFSNAIFSKFLEDKKSKISAISSGGFLLFGVIYRECDDFAVCIGPVRTEIITADLYSSLKNIDTSDEKYIADVVGYLKSMPLVNSERLYRIVDNISLFLCGRPFDGIPEAEIDSSVKYADMVAGFVNTLSAPLEADSRPTRANIKVTRDIPAGGTFKVEATNNPFDASPRLGGLHERSCSRRCTRFHKQDQHGGGRGDALTACWVSGIGGNFE